MSQLAADQYWHLIAKIHTFSLLSPEYPVELDSMGPYKQIIPGILGVALA